MSEENKNVADALNEIFEDDPAKKARDREIEKYEKKRQKAIEREQKRAEKKEKKNAASENKKAGQDEQTETGEKDDGIASWSWDKAVAESSGNNKEKPESEEKDDVAASNTGAVKDAEIVADADTVKASDKMSDADEEIDDKAVRKKIKAEKKAEKKQKKSEKEVNIVRDLIMLCIYILVVIGLCWTVLNYVGQRTEVSGESMSNTLHSGDTLWIDKLEYEFGSPKRFDVVVFPYGDDNETFYIKRIIGLPGETVYIDEDGTIYINDEPLDGDVYGREIIDEDKRGVAAEEVVLGEDEYFVLGDNRNNSRDSRVAEVGNIHKNDIIGRAVFRFTGGFGKIE